MGVPVEPGRPASPSRRSTSCSAYQPSGCTNTVVPLGACPAGSPWTAAAARRAGAARRRAARSRPSKPSSRSASTALAPARPAPTIDERACIGHGGLLRSGSQRRRVAGERRRTRRASARRRAASVQRRGDGACVPAARTPRSVMQQVLGLDDHADTARREVGLQPVGDLLGQPLLDLRAAGEQLDDPGELRQPEDPLAGQVADVRDADERQQVVLADRLHRDVAGEHQLVVPLVVGERGEVERRAA